MFIAVLETNSSGWETRWTNSFTARSSYRIAAKQETGLSWLPSSSPTSCGGTWRLPMRRVLGEHDPPRQGALPTVRAAPERASDRFVVRNFRKECLRDLVKIKTA